MERHPPRGMCQLRNCSVRHRQQPVTQAARGHACPDVRMSASSAAARRSRRTASARVSSRERRASRKIRSTRQLRSLPRGLFRLRGACKCDHPSGRLLIADDPSEPSSSGRTKQHQSRVHHRRLPGCARRRLGFRRAMRQEVIAPSSEPRLLIGTTGGRHAPELPPSTTGSSNRRSSSSRWPPRTPDSSSRRSSVVAMTSENCSLEQFVGCHGHLVTPPNHHYELLPARGALRGRTRLARCRSAAFCGNTRPGRCARRCCLRRGLRATHRPGVAAPRLRASSSRC
jgi:hypothetical protein